MKLRRRDRVAISENDRVYLIANNNNNNNNRAQDHSKIAQFAWKLTKGTWKALKIGFRTMATSQPFYFAVEPTAIATTIVEYRVNNR